MNLGLLLIPALGGYYLLGRSFVSRYWLARQSGYALFFSAAIAGVFLLVVARLLAMLLPPDPAWPIVAWWSNYAPFDYAGTVLISGLLAGIIPEIVNLVTRKHDCAKRAARARGDLIECLIQEAIESKGRQIVEVSTKSSKSYIGFAQHSSVTAGSESDIAITPIISGYRDSKTRDLTLTTNYLPVLLNKNLHNEEFLEHFRVVIPLAEVASARLFDPDAYQLFDHANTDGKNPSNGEAAT